MNVEDDDGGSSKSAMLNALVLYFSNPWVILLAGVLIYYGLVLRYWPRLQRRWEEFMDRRSEEQYQSAMRNNPDLFRRRMEEMEKARKKQQERYEAAASGVGQPRSDSSKTTGNKSAPLQTPHESSGSGSTTSTRARLRPDYNPLMGSGGTTGAGFRPARRNCNPSG